MADKASIGEEGDIRGRVITVSVPGDEESVKILGRKCSRKYTTHIASVPSPVKLVGKRTSTKTHASEHTIGSGYES